MNQFTKQFHEQQFPGVVLNCDINDIMSNFWTNSELPFVEVDLEFEHTSTLTWLQDHTHLFAPVESQVNLELKNEALNASWFTEPNSNGWSEFKVLDGASIPNAELVNSTETYTKTEYSIEPVPDAVPDLQNFFKNKNIKITHLHIAKLAPGGWLQPHIDKKVTEVPSMQYFWMPLNYFPPSMKIYPFGNLEHKLGCMYLLNHRKMVHSVINLSNSDRYVANGNIDYTCLPTALCDKIYRSATKQWA